MNKSEPPPPYGFQPPPATCSLPVTVVQHAPVQYGPQSQTLVCPYCQKQISTRVETSAVAKTHLFALILCLLGCWPCVCIPYCMDSCQSSTHYCPSCNAFLGAYNQ